MAPGAKSRSTKQRSTSGGGSSTITIFICIALSLFLLWLLTSNTFAPTSTSTTSTSRKSIPTSSNHHHQPLTHEAHHVDHEDIPTHIPDALPIHQTPPDHPDPASSSKDDDLQPKTTTTTTTDDDIAAAAADNTDEPNTTDNTSNNDDVVDDPNTTTTTTTADHDNSSNNDDLDDPKTTTPDVEDKQSINDDPNTTTTTTTADQNTSNNDVVTTSDQNNDDDPKTDDNDPTTKETAVEAAVVDDPKTDDNDLKAKDTAVEQQSETKQANVVEDENQDEKRSSNDEVTEKDNQQRIGKHHEKQDEIKHELHSRDTHGAISHDQVAHNSQVRNETKKAWSTQADQSDHEKERRKSDKSSTTWLLCNVTAGADYIPCLDNEKAIARLRSRKHHEHRERHCPEDAPTCLVPMPNGYKTRIDWPQSRDKIWYHNVPHTMLAEVKGHQNWVKVTGEFLTFPGGGTQFIHGALHYIDFVQEAVANIAWGKHSRVILDVGCGVASLGGYLFERDVIAMSLAPKDEHEAQVQMALERGIPAISAVMGSQRLPFPSRVFDIVHCARCRVPWHADGGALLLELNRVLRPGGYFVWSATPVYQKLEEDVQIWNEMSNLTAAMCWELVTIKKDALNSIGAAVYQKPETNECYEQRKQNEPPMCKSDDDPNAAWYIPLQSCMHPIPLQENERGSQWPEEWPDRLQTPPYWLNKTQPGIYGKPAPDDFASDYKHWKKMVAELYMEGLGVSWAHVRNVMDMRAVYGGFAAALRELKVWVMNVVNVDSPDTLPLIYERGLFGIYHDWCESFSTYPRTYDLLHADHLFSTLKKRCNMVMVMAEIDRIVRPGGILIVRDDSETIGEVDEFLKSLHWEVNIPNNQQAGILAATKSDWRPDSYAEKSKRLLAS